jgi:ribose 5-phosphate isomerase
VSGPSAPHPARWLAETVGVVEHGLFPATMVSEVVIARGEQIEIRRVH